MNKDKTERSPEFIFSKPLKIITVAALLIALTGCFFTLNYFRHTIRTGGLPVAWWCQGSPDLSVGECQDFSAVLDSARNFAYRNWTRSEGLAEPGASVYPHNSRIVLFGLTSTFTAGNPNLIHYESTAPDARAIAVGWLISGSEPAGFAGSRDVWAADTDGNWMLNMWMLRGYENHPNLFAASHPCESDLPLTSTNQPCFLASHTVPLEVLVTNDDGYFAHGIDALVQALTNDPNDPNDPFVAGINVTVVAPLTQQSGQGGSTTPGGAQNSTLGLTTASGYPVAAAVHGTPADTVIWALQVMHLSPDVILSGINEGQNMGNVGHLFSGTVGAARTGALRVVPAIASSQGLPPDPNTAVDFPAGVDATLALFERWRIGAAGEPVMNLPNINIPTCVAGSSIRATLDNVIVAESLMGRPYGPADCNSTETVINDDVDAFNHGYIGIGDMGRKKPPNFP